MRALRAFGLLVATAALTACASEGVGAGASPAARPATRVALSTAEQPCTASQLQATYLQPPLAAAGQLVAALRLDRRDPSGAPCRLVGYPGVSLVDAAGRQIGPAAGRAPVSATLQPAPVSVGPGSSAFVELLTQRGDGVTACTAASTAVRVYLPDSAIALSAPASMRLCGGRFLTGPVTGRSPFPASAG